MLVHAYMWFRAEPHLVRACCCCVCCGLCCVLLRTPCRLKKKPPLKTPLTKKNKKKNKKKGTYYSNAERELAEVRAALFVFFGGDPLRGGHHH